MKAGSTLLLLAMGASVEAATYAAKGCYAVSSLQSRLTSKGEYTYQTNSYCEIQCSGYSVAATLDGSTCYCGNSLPSNIDTVDSSNCDVNCQGYPSEICGGSGYLSVYTNGEEDTDVVESSSSATTQSKTASSSSTSITSSSTTTTSSSSSLHIVVSSSATSTSSSSSSSTTAYTTSSSSSSSITTISPSSTTASPSSSSLSSSTTTAYSSSITPTPSSSITSSSSSSSPGIITSVQIVTSIISASDKVATITHTISATMTPTSTSTSSALATPSSVSKHSSLSKGAIAGIAIGSIVGVLLLIGALLFCCCFIRPKNEDDEEEQTEKVEQSPAIHNEDYHNWFGGFQQPSLPYGTDASNADPSKRLSNGSLLDINLVTSKLLRVMNPDDEMKGNDTTLGPETSVDEGEVSSVSDDSYWKKS